MVSCNNFQGWSQKVFKRCTMPFLQKHKFLSCNLFLPWYLKNSLLGIKQQDLVNIIYLICTLFENQTEI
jgi:hypothetical protein